MPKLSKKERTRIIKKYAKKSMDTSDLLSFIKYSTGVTESQLHELTDKQLIKLVKSKYPDILKRGKKCD